MQKWNGTIWEDIETGTATLALNDLSDVEAPDPSPDEALVRDDDGIWRPRFISGENPEQPAVEIVGYDSYEGNGPYTFDISGVLADDIALLSRISANTANGAYSTTSTGFTNLGSANFGGDFGVAYKFMQTDETVQIGSSGAGPTSCALIVIRNAELASFSVGAERWSFAVAAPQSTAPPGSLDVIMSARRMNTPPAGWVPRIVDEPGGCIATKAYVNETSLATEYFQGGSYEYNGGGRVLFTLPS